MTNEAPETRVRVLLLLPSLNGGGAERVALHLLSKLDSARFDVRMGLLRRGGNYMSTAEDPSRIEGPRFGERWLNFDRGNKAAYRLASLLPALALTPLNVLAMLWRFRPHVVLSFRKGMSVVAMVSVCLYGRSHVRWIAREGNNSTAVIDDELHSKLARRAMRWLMRLCYRSADRTLTLCQEMADGLQRELGLERSRMHVIHNAVDVTNVQRRSFEPAALRIDGPYVIAVGRLERQKGFDVLLRAFAESHYRTSHRLVLLGEGNEQAALRQLSRELHLEQRVVFAGFQDNPWALMRRAELFVLPSRWEGFANVVIEAMACRVPVLVSDCDYGPKEIVRDGHDGVVVPSADARALCAAMDRLLGDPRLRFRLAACGAARARDFDVSVIVQRYEQLFLQVVEHAPLTAAPVATDERAHA